MTETFRQELEALLNRHSLENGSNTPDFVLAQVICDVLRAWDAGVQRREAWYGREPKFTGGSGPAPKETR